MYVSKYEPKADNWTLMRALKKRDKDPKEVYNLPKIGFLAFEGDYFIGAGFIRQCEGGYGMFDSYITDPMAHPKLRDQALELITKSLVDKAKELGIKHLVAFSVDANTIVRSQKHGFVLLEHKVLTRAI